MDSGEFGVEDADIHDKGRSEGGELCEAGVISDRLRECEVGALEEDSGDKVLECLKD